MKRRILLFVKIPPPVTGATLMNQRVVDSMVLKKAFKIRTIGISYNNTLNQMGDWRLKKIFKIISYSGQLFKQLIIFKPSLIYFQVSPHGFAFLRDSIYVFIIKLFSIKIVYHMRGKGIAAEIKSPIKRILYKSVFKKQYVITLSKRLNYDIEPIYSGYIYNVPNGIENIDINSFLSSKNKRRDPVKLLYLSNLIVSKGILDFLEALSFLSSKDVNFNATIVGAEGTLSKIQLMKIIKDKKLEDYISYLGALYGKEKHKVLSNSDVLVFPTKNDIWGNVNLEAMQFSIPVIATNEGAISEIVDDGITGFIIEKNSPEQIAEKIQLLIDNPELRKSMGEAGRKKYLEKYTIDKFEQNLKEVFEDILNSEENEK